MLDSGCALSKHGEQHVIFQEYNDIVEELKRELEICKTEQNGIRSKLETLHNENRSSSDAVRDYISRIHLEECGNEDAHNKIVINLKERIAILQIEKDSAVQLWQVSMKAVDALEQELKTRPVEGRDIKFYEERLKDVRQSYSEAVKALEGKLLQAKENFTKQQSLWISSKETIETLTREKQEAAKRFQEFQQNTQQKDRNNQQRMESLMEELSVTKAEIQKLNLVKTDLEKRLNESRKINSNIIVKNEETRCKMAETLDLIESAVKEKDIVLQREALIMEQKIRLEARLASIGEEYDTKIQEEITKLKDVHERNVKKYLLEIKELKSELRKKVVLLNQSQRDNRLTEEELDKALKHADFKSEACNETCKKQYTLEMQQLQQEITNLKEKLADSNERLKEIQQQNTTDERHRIKLADERTKDAIDRYVNLESQLIKAVDDKKSMTTELKFLQSAFHREIYKRDNERHTLENRIRELEAYLQKENCVMENKLGANISPIQASSCGTDAINKHTVDIRVENMGTWQPMLSEQLHKQQENFDKKIKEMTQHVTVHQKLSRRWREEAKSLTTRFQVKSKELHGKISTLRKENAELHKALLICGHQFNQFKTDAIHSYVQGTETR